MNRIWILFCFVILKTEYFCLGHRSSGGQFFQFRRQDSREHNPEYGSREVRKHERGQGKGGSNFWQFKRTSSEEPNRQNSGWNGVNSHQEQDSWRNDFNSQQQQNGGGWGQDSRPGGRSRGRRPPESDKTRIVIQIPSSLAKLFKKKTRKPDRGRGIMNRRRPPHEQYAPAFISYGPIFAEHPSKPQQVQGPAQPSLTLSHRIIATAPSFQYGTPSQRPYWSFSTSRASQAPSSSYGTSQAPTSSYDTQQTSSYGPSPSPSSSSSYGHPEAQSPSYGSRPQSTTPNSIPVPTYGPPVRFQYAQPEQQKNSHYSTSNKLPNQYQPPNQWDELQSNNRRPTVTIEQSQEYVPPLQRQLEQPPAPTYIPPQSSSATPGWTTWDEGSQTQNRNQNSQTWQHQQQQKPQIPMSFGPPMQNFGPPHSSYGQPPPIFGDPRPDRYAPKEDIYRYPTDNQPKPRNQFRGQHQQQGGRQQYDQHKGQNEDAHVSASESEEFYQKPSTDIYQLPQKSYREPRRRNQKQQVQYEEEQDDGDDEHQENFQKDSRYNGERSHYSGKRIETVPPIDQRPNDPNARPAPNFDTNYNSPGFSKDLKIVDWMPYSAKNYHEIPGKRKRKTPRYKTLPDSLHNYRPDPEHEKYPKLTYDSISKRSLPILASMSPSQLPIQNSKNRSLKKFPRRKAKLEMKTEKKFQIVR